MVRAVRASGQSDGNALVALVSGRCHSTTKSLQKFPPLPEASVGKEAGIQAHRTLQVKTLSGNVHVSLEKEGSCFSRSNNSWKLTRFIHALSICHLLGKLNLVQKFL